MKSAILYATTKKPRAGSGHTLISKGWRGGLCRVWIRCKIVNDDVSGALDKAKPRPGEIVLNTIPLP